MLFNSQDVNSSYILKRNLYEDRFFSYIEAKGSFSANIVNLGFLKKASERISEKVFQEYNSYVRRIGRRNSFYLNIPFDIDQHEGIYFLAFSLTQHLSLSSWLEEQVKLPKEIILYVLRDSLLALKDLEDMGESHLFLTPDEVLIPLQWKKNDHVVLNHCGLFRMLKGNMDEDEVASHRGKYWKGEAGEDLFSSKMNISKDLYSLGIIAGEMLSLLEEGDEVWKEGMGIKLNALTQQTDHFASISEVLSFFEEDFFLIQRFGMGKEYFNILHYPQKNVIDQTLDEENGPVEVEDLDESEGELIGDEIDELEDVDTGEQPYQTDGGIKASSGARSTVSLEEEQSEKGFESQINQKKVAGQAIEKIKSFFNGLFSLKKRRLRRSKKMNPSSQSDTPKHSSYSETRESDGSRVQDILKQLKAHFIKSSEVKKDYTHPGAGESLPRFFIQKKDKMKSTKKEPSFNYQQSRQNPEERSEVVVGEEGKVRSVERDYDSPSRSPGGSRGLENPAYQGGEESTIPESAGRVNPWGDFAHTKGGENPPPKDEADQEDNSELPRDQRQREEVKEKTSQRNNSEGIPTDEVLEGEQEITQNVNKSFWSRILEYIKKVLKIS